MVYGTCEYPGGQDAFVALAKRVKKGETIILCERNVPIAEIRPLEKEFTKVRLGLFKGQIGSVEDFDEPIKGFEDDFYGEEIPG